MDFEKIYNECNKFSENIFAYNDEYGIEVFTSGKWEILKRNQGRYNLYKGYPVGFKTEEDALKLIDELKHTISFQNNKMRLTTDIRRN